METGATPPDRNSAEVRSVTPPVVNAAVDRSYGYDYYDDDSGAGGLLEYWHLVKRHSGLLILAAVLGALVSVLYSIPQTPLYQATATIEIQVMNPDFLHMSELSVYDDSNQAWDNLDIQTQIEVMQSDTLLDRVVQRLAREGPVPLSTETGRVSAWRRAFNLPEPAPVDPYADALDMAEGSLDVNMRGDTRIVDVSVSSTDPRVAANFANTLCDEFIEQNLQSRWEMSRRTGEWLSRQLDEMRIRLERSEGELHAYARRSGLMYTSEQGNVAEDRLRQLQSSLSAAQAERVARQSRYEMVSKSPPESLPDVLSDESLRKYQSQLTALRSQAASLSTTFTPEHSKVRRVQAQIHALESALQQERQAIVGRIYNEYEETLRRENLLTAEYEAQADLVNQQSAKSVQYNILKREVDSNRELYEMMLEKVKSAAVVSALRASNIRLVDPAKPPAGPLGKNLKRNALAGMMLGGFLGVAFIITRDRMNRSLQQPGDIAHFVNLPELGTIPDASRRTGVRIIYRPKKKPKQLSAQKTMIAVPAKKDLFPRRVELATARGKPTLVAESFRSTLTSILFSGTNGSRPRVLTVTSPHAGEGKTTVISNLAIALAEANQRVLLIDADLRKPRLHEVFEVSRDPGLSTLLLAEGTLEPETVGAATRATKVNRLFLLPSGEPVSGSTNLFYPARLSRLLERFEKEYDMVLIDTPPMMQIPDARVIGRMSHAVVLVVRAGDTTRDNALIATQRFAEDGTRVLGSILNRYNPESGTGAYRYYDRYYQTYPVKV